MNRKRFAAALASLVLLLSLCACGEKNETPQAAMPAVETPETASAAPGSAMFLPALRAVDGVTDVQPVEQGEAAAFKEKYILTFELPADRNDRERGTVNTRVLLGIRGLNATCVVNTDGCYLVDPRFAREDHELAEKLSANYIHIECRCYSPASPALDNDSAGGWDILSAENCAGDCHEIVSALSKLLTGEKIVTGSGTGGLCAALCTSLYPEDMALTVLYATPLCNGTDDGRLYQAVYSAAGSAYGSSKAESFLRMISRFQIECISRRDTLAGEYWDYALENGAVFRKALTPETLFDLAVADWPVAFRQYGPDFALLEEILTMKASPEKDAALLELLEIYRDPFEWSADGSYFASHVQAAKEYGSYRYELSYLRKILEAEELELCIGKETEEEFFKNLLFTPEQQAAFVYDPSLYERLLDWEQNTENDVVFIYGSEDPWTAVRFPSTTNPHVRLCIAPAGNADAGISSLQRNDQLLITRLLEDAVKAGGEP